MTDLFEPLRINGMEIANRFVRSATMDNMAVDGRVSDAQVRLYRALGSGGIGLIVSHGLYPAGEGRTTPGQLAVDSDRTVPSLKRLVDAVHEQHGKIAAQILHGGWLCRPEVTGRPPVGPSPLVNPATQHEVRALSGPEVEELIGQYVDATRRIAEAGFDAVQLHAAHSWLLSAFLSPATNRREDEWGGSAKNRTRLVCRICERIRKMVGPDYPLLVKLGIEDHHPAGKSATEGVAQARALVASGADAIEVSEGLEGEFFRHIRRGADAPYYLEECRAAKRALSVPVLLVGGMRRLADMRAVLEKGTADAVSMCRPFIADPHVVRRFRNGSADRAQCTSCNQCLARLVADGLRCWEIGVGGRIV